VTPHCCTEQASVKNRLVCPSCIGTHRVLVRGNGADCYSVAVVLIHLLLCCVHTTARLLVPAPQRNFPVSQNVLKLSVAGWGRRGGASAKRWPLLWGGRGSTTWWNHVDLHGECAHLTWTWDGMKVLVRCACGVCVCVCVCVCVRCVRKCPTPSACRHCLAKTTAVGDRPCVSHSLPQRGGSPPPLPLLPRCVVVASTRVALAWPASCNVRSMSNTHTQNSLLSSRAGVGPCHSPPAFTLGPRTLASPSPLTLHACSLRCATSATQRL
jgi:hypothetical protein